jgi:hypothetical protein
MKRLLLVITICVLLFIAASGAWYVLRLHNNNKPITHTPSSVTGSKKLNEKLGNIVMSAKQYCKTNRFNTQICFFADMSMESGKSRFFVYDMNKDSIMIG